MSEARRVFRRSSAGGTFYGAQYSTLCPTAVMKYVDLPPGILRFEAVFTKVRQPESFSIERRKSRWNYMIYNAKLVGVWEYVPAGYLLEQMYQAGYRYVHVEY